MLNQKYFLQMTSLLFMIAIAIPAFADDVLVNDRKATRALDDASDALGDLTKSVDRSDLRRRDQDAVEKLADRVSDGIRDVKKAFKRAKAQGDAVLVDKKRVLGDINDAIEDLEDLEDEVKDLQDDMARYKDVIKDLEDIEDALKDVEDLVKDGKKPSAKKSGGSAMDKASFNALVKQAKGLTYDDDRVKLMKTVAKGNKLTSAQVRSLMQLFTYDDNRVVAGVVLYKSVVDKKNWFKVYDVFTYSDSATKLQKQTQ